MIVVPPTTMDSTVGLRRASRARGTASARPSSTDTTVIQTCWIVASVSSGR